MSSDLFLRLRSSFVAISIAVLAAFASAQIPTHADAAAKSPLQIGAGIPVVENYTTKDYSGFGQTWTMA